MYAKRDYVSYLPNINSNDQKLCCIVTNFTYNKDLKIQLPTNQDRFMWCME